MTHEQTIQAAISLAKEIREEIDGGDITTEDLHVLQAALDTLIGDIDAAFLRLTGRTRRDVVH